MRRKEYAKAGRLLESIARRRNRTEWDRGYYTALVGMLSALESDGRGYTLIRNLDGKDLRRICKEFRDYATHELLRPFDRGFFTAWLHYAKMLTRTHEDK